MSITDNVLRKQQVQREVACLIVLNPADIIVGDRLRALDRESVERLKESISRIGLKTPISVRSSSQGWTLVAGRHRLAACIELGTNQIQVVVETSSELEARLWEIAENLHRAELTALERAEHISRWIKLRGERGAEASCDQADDKLDQVGPVSELIPARGGRGREGGVRAAARELGISRTAALRAVQRVDRISPAVREALRDIPEIADNGVELDALAALPAEQQAAAVGAVQNGGAPSARAAIATSAQPTGHKDPAARRERAGKPVGRACGSVARGNQWRVRLPPSSDRRIAAAGGAECLRHAESSRCQGRPGPGDQRSGLRAGLRDRQSRMGGAAAAPTKQRLTAPTSDAPVEALGFQSLGEIPL